MSLREALAAVHTTDYDRFGALDQPMFECLDRVAEELRRLVPGHYLLPVSRGVGNLPIGLWVSILDPEVTETPTKGTYVVFLFDEARQRVSLSLNQGVTNARLDARQGGEPLRPLLRRRAEQMRGLLDEQRIGTLETEITLGRRNLLRDYEAGNVVARTWPLPVLPDEAELVETLELLLDLYAEVVPEYEHAKASGAVKGASPRDPALTPNERERRFIPKDDSDYLAHIGAQEQQKSRSHETLLRSLKEWLDGRGLEANNNVHPRDLVIHGGGHDLLVEMKVFPAGRPRRGVRECIGQLFEYRRFYPDWASGLVAALSSHPGEAYIGLFDELGIAVIWPEGKLWAGTTRARGYNLVS
jgi:hypothetical protein